MQRSPSFRAFTLVEMIIVLAIIVILAGLVLALAAPVGTKGRYSKAKSQMMTLFTACEAYRTDYGGYPQDNSSGASSASVTDALDPRIHFNPTAAVYAASNLFLYKQLTGDENANGAIDASETSRKYANDFFKASPFDTNYRVSGTISYFVDPFGYAFGYSTAGLKAEQDYQVSQQSDSAAARPAGLKGYNPTFDLWSTGGSTRTTAGDEPKWLKNW